MFLVSSFIMFIHIDVRFENKIDFSVWIKSFKSKAFMVRLEIKVYGTFATIKLLITRFVLTLINIILFSLIPMPYQF